jgi:hypothetical protein
VLHPPPSFWLRPEDGADVVLFSSTDAQQFGRVIVAAGDVNGDGFDDFLISDTAFRGHDNWGSVFLIFGGTFDIEGLAENGIDLSPNGAGLDGIGYRFGHGTLVERESYSAE